jgi:hypothetical protein
VLSAVTNDLGDYSIFWMPPGRYYILATIYDGPPRTAPIVTSIGDNTGNVAITPSPQFVFTKAISSVISDTEMHVPMFHPGVSNLREARAIDVEPGTTIRNIDVRVDTVHALHVRGSVSGVPLTANGVPARVTVALFSTDGSNPTRSATGTVERDMSFDIPSVRPGSYILAATGGTSTTRAPVEVHDRDVNGVKVDLQPGITVTGRVVFEGQTAENTSLVFSAVRMILLPDPIPGGFKDDIAAALPVPAFRPTPTSNGSFTTSGYPPGFYQIVVPPLLGPPAGWTSPEILAPALTSTTLPPALENAYVKSVRLGDADVLNDGLNLSSSIRDPLVITIGTNAGAVEGRVVNGGKQPAAAATVVLIPENRHRFRIAHRYAITDADGRFRISGVAPGEYKLFAWEQIEKGAWQDPEFVRDYESTAKSVRVEEGSRLTVELQANVK